MAFDLAEMSGNAQSSTNSLKGKNEALVKMVQTLETEVDRKSQMLNNTEKKLASVEEEFRMFKVRATV